MRQTVLLLTLALAACGGGRSLAPPPLAQPGAYRAFGNTPMWELAVDTANIVYVDRSNRVRVVQRTPRGAAVVAGMPIRTARIQVATSRERCVDAVSGRSYPDRVQVTVDGRSFMGCGGEPLTTSLANGNWVVEQVNGKATGGGAGFGMQFSTDRFNARFGCNVVNGKYAVTSVTFSAGAAATTRRSCPDMSFEQEALGVLSEPATLVWSSSDQVAIGNAKGQIKLRRAI